MQLQLSYFSRINNKQKQKMGGGASISCGPTTVEKNGVCHAPASISCGPTTFEEGGLCHAEFPVPLKVDIEAMHKGVEGACKVSDISEEDCDKRIKQVDDIFHRCIYDKRSTTEDNFKSCIGRGLK